MKKKYIIPFTEVITTKTESLLHAGTIVNRDGAMQQGIEQSREENLEGDSKTNYWHEHFDLWSK